MLIRSHKKMLISTDARVGQACANDGETPLLIHASIIHVRPSTDNQTRLPAYVHGCISPFPPGSYMYVHIRSHLHVCMRREACSQPRSHQLGIKLCLQHANREVQNCKACKLSALSYITLRNSIDVAAFSFSRHIHCPGKSCVSVCSSSGTVPERSAEHAKQRSRTRAKVNVRRHGLCVSYGAMIGHMWTCRV